MADRRHVKYASMLAVDMLGAYLNRSMVMGCISRSDELTTTIALNDGSNIV